MTFISWVMLAVGLSAGGGFGFVLGVLMGRRSGESEADADHQRRQNQAIIADQERADVIAEKADVAAAGAGGVPAAVRLRKAGRLRETGN